MFLDSRHNSNTPLVLKDECGAEHGREAVDGLAAVCSVGASYDARPLVEALNDVLESGALAEIKLLSEADQVCNRRGR
jgi:hypothetical protein